MLALKAQERRGERGNTSVITRNRLLTSLVGALGIAGMTHTASATDFGNVSAFPPTEPEAEATAPETATPGAQTPEAKAAQQWHFRFGLGLGVVPDYMGSDDYKLAPIPQFTARKQFQYVNITGAYLTSNVLPSANWRLGAAARYISDNRCSAENNRVNNMNCLSQAFMLGPTVGYVFPIKGINNRLGMLTPTLETLFDVSGANDGFTVEPQLNYTQKLSERWGGLLRGFMTIGSENYENYYFGVNSRQSRQSGLPQHDADGGVQQMGFLAAGDYSMTDNWTLTLLGRYARMMGDAADSPLVDGNHGVGNANQFLAGAVISYGW